MSRTYSLFSGLALSLLGVALGAGGPVGCGDDFAPPSVVTGLRVLALQADPLEVGPGEAVTVRPTLAVDPADPVASLTWSFCPLTLGAATGHRCALPACDRDLGPGDGQGAVTVVPSALAQECLAQALASGEAGAGAPDGVPAELPAQVTTVFRLTAVSAGGDRRDAVLQLPLLLDGPPAERNRPPEIAEVLVDGEPVPASGVLPGAVAEGERREVRVVVRAESLAQYVDDAGRERVEEAIVSFYASDGRFDDDRTAGRDTVNRWEASPLRPETREVRFWVVVRDLRGGQAIAGPFVMEVAR